MSGCYNLIESLIGNGSYYDKKICMYYNQNIENLR